MNTDKCGRGERCGLKNIRIRLDRALVLKVRVFGTQKWPIIRSDGSGQIKVHRPGLYGLNRDRPGRSLELLCVLSTRSYFTLAQGCALRKISGSPSGSQAFYLSRPGLNVCRPNKNFGEPFGLPSIPAGVPRPLKLVARVHLMSKYFVRTRILLAC